MQSYSSGGAAPGARFPLMPTGAGALVGPDGGQVSGMLDPAPGHGASIDARLDDLDGRVSALEAGEVGEIS
jgi:hypothetical protein